MACIPIKLPVALFDHTVNTMGCQTRGSTVIYVISTPCRPTTAVRLDIANGVAALAGELHTVKKVHPEWVDTEGDKVAPLLNTSTKSGNV